MKKKRNIINIDENLCNGCGECVPSCAEGAIQVVEGKAKLVAEVYCDGLGACLGHCPQGALEIIEREADDFDEDEVEKHLKSIEKKEEPTGEIGCPSSRTHIFGGPTPCEVANRPTIHSQGSALGHWPVQLRLVSPEAPFLKGSDLLIAADCTAFAYAGFHEDFLKGKVLLIGCPKFDNAELYLERLTDIFKEADIKSVTVLVMEVPCCQGMRAIVEHAVRDSGKKIPVNVSVIGVRGRVLQPA